MARRKQKQRRQLSSRKRREQQANPSTPLNAQLGYQKLEPRRVLTPVVNLVGTVIEIDMQADGDGVSINHDGTDFIVTDSDANVFNFADVDVEGIQISETGGPHLNNFAKFFDTFILEGFGGKSLTVDGIETIQFNKGTTSGDFTFQDDVSIQDATSITDNGGKARLDSDTVFSIDAAAANISFTNSGNDFTQVGVTANNVTIVDTNSIELLSSTIGGSLTVDSGADITDAEDAKIDVTGSGTFDAEGSITLADDAANDGTDSLTIGGLAKFTASDGTANANNPVTVGGNMGTANFGTLNFTSDTAVNITEGSAMDLSGTSTADSVVLTAADSINEAATTDLLNVTNNATFDISTVSGSLNIAKGQNDIGGTVSITGVTDDLRITNVNAKADASDIIDGPLTLDNLEIRHPNAPIVIPGKTLNITNALILEAGDDGVLDDSITDVVNTKIFANSATLIGTKDITIGDGVTNTFQISKDFTVSSDQNINVGALASANVINFGSLNFNADGDVNIVEDGSTKLFGSNSANNLSLTAEVSGNIEDDTTTIIKTVGDASFNATFFVTLNDTANDKLLVGGQASFVGPSGITVGGLGQFTADTINFTSTTGSVTIQQDSDTVITGTNLAVDLSVSSTGEITDDDANVTSITVTNDAVFDADSTITLSDIATNTLVVTKNAKFVADDGNALNSNNDINVGANSLFTSSSLTFSSVDTVTIEQLGATSIAGTNKAGDLSLTSTLDITNEVNSSITVTDNAFFNTATDIDLGNAVGDTVNFGSVGFKANKVAVTEDSAMHLDGTTVKSLDLVATNLITQSGDDTGAGTGAIITTGTADFELSSGKGSIELSKSSIDPLVNTNDGTFQDNSIAGKLTVTGVDTNLRIRNTSATADIGDLVSSDISLKNLEIRHTKGDIVVPGFKFTISENLILEAGGKLIDAKDAAFDVEGNATFIAGGKLTLNDDATNLLDVKGNATFIADDGDAKNSNNNITVGGDGTAFIGTTTFSSVDDVSIQQDNKIVIQSTSDVVTNTAGNLTLNATGTITDDQTGATPTETKIAVSDNADLISTDKITLNDSNNDVFTVGKDATFKGPNGITIGGKGTFEAGSINFGISTGAVTIQQDSAMVVTGINQADSLDLSSTDSITDDDSTTTKITVTNDASFDAGTTITLNNKTNDLLSIGNDVSFVGDDGITIGGLGDFDAKTINFNSVDGKVDIQEDDAIIIKGVNTADSLSLSSTDSITDDDAATTKIIVDNEATFDAATSIILNNNLNDVLTVGTDASFVAPDGIKVGGDGTFTTQTLNFDSSAGDVDIQVDSSAILKGDNQATKLTLDATGSITDDAGNKTTLDVGTSAKITAGDKIALLNDGDDTLIVITDLVIAAPNGITIGDAGTFEAKTINFTSTNGEVNISEDNATVITGVNVAKSLTITSTDSITDNDLAVTTIKVTNDATFNAGSTITLNNKLGEELKVGGDASFVAPDGITVGGDGLFTAKTLNFVSTDGTVNIQQDSSIVIKGINDANKLILDTTDSISDDDGAVTKINVDTTSSMTATKTITLNNNTDDEFNVTGDATFTAPLGISIGSKGDFTAGSINFTSTNGAVSIHEDDATIIKGVNVADSLLITSTKSITDDDSAKTLITVTNDATFEAGTTITLNDTADDKLNIGNDAKFKAPTQITIGGDGNFTAKTINFDSDNGTVNIQEDDAIIIKGTNDAKALVLNSTGSITDDDSAATVINVDTTSSMTAASNITLNDKTGDSLTIGGDATFSAPTGISIGGKGNFTAGSINFSSAAGTVDIQEDDAMTIKGVNDAKTLILNSTKSITDDDSAATEISVTTTATLTAGDKIVLNETDDDKLLITDAASFTAPNGIAIGGDGEFKAASITFVSTDGTVDIQEDDAMVITGITNDANKLVLSSKADITDDPATKINVDTDASFDAATFIKLNDSAMDLLKVGQDASFVAPNSITVGDVGDFFAGSINFVSTGGVVTIQEDDSTIIKGDNEAKALVLESEGSITDDDGAKTTIDVDTTASFKAKTSIDLNNNTDDVLAIKTDATFFAPDGINVGQKGTFTAGTINFTSSAGAVTIQEDDATIIKGTNQAKSLSVTSTQSIIDDDGAVTKINVDESASFTAGTTITLNNNTNDALIIGTDSSFTAPDGITIGGKGNFTAGTLNFVSTDGTVDIQEDDATVIKGINDANVLILSSTQSITDEDGKLTKINVDTNSTMTAGTFITLNNDTDDTLTIGNDASFVGPDGITIGGQGTFTAQTINFVSTNGTVDIQEDDSMIIKGTNDANKLVLSSTGSITDDDGAKTIINSDTTASFDAQTTITLNNNMDDELTVGTDASFKATDGITVGDAGKFTAGTINFVSTKGDVTIQEDDAIIIQGVNDAENLTLKSTSSITDADATIIDVAKDATFVADTFITLNDKGGDSLTVGKDASFTAPTGITIGKAGTFTADTINFVSTGGTVDIQEDDSMVIKGINDANKLVLSSTGSITDNDAAATKINVDTTASFDAATTIELNNKAGDELIVGGNASFVGPNGITIGELGKFQADSITFVSTNGDVTVQEDDDTKITGTNFADQLTINSAGSITDASGTKINVDQNAIFNSADAISLNDSAGDTLIVGGNSSFSAPTSITIGSTGKFESGSITFDSAGDVTIQEDNDTTITSTNAITVNKAANLTITSTGSITDQQFAKSPAMTQIVTTGDATFKATNSIELGDTAGDLLKVAGDATFDGPNGILVGQTGTFNAATVNFDSGATVKILERSDMNVRGDNTAGTLELKAEGFVHDQTDTSILVTGNADIIADTDIKLADTAKDVFTSGGLTTLTGKTGIEMGLGGVANFGSLTFNTSNGDAEINEGSSTLLRGDNTANNLTLTSAGSIEDATDTDITIDTGFAKLVGKSITLNNHSDDSFNVATNVSLTATTGDIMIGSDGNAEFGSVTFSAVNGKATIQEDSSMLLTGANVAQSANLQATDGGKANITDDNATSIEITAGNADFIADGSIKLNDFKGDVLTVAGRASFDAGKTINVGSDNSTSKFDSLNFNATGSTTILEDGNMIIAGSNTAGSLVLETTMSGGESGTITDSKGTSIVVSSGNAKFLADGSIKLNDMTGDLLQVEGNALFDADDSITVGGSDGKANFKSLTFRSDNGLVQIQEDSSTLLDGTNQADQLILESTGSITDNNDTTVRVKVGDATFDAGDMIKINEHSSNRVIVNGRAKFLAETGILVGDDGDAMFGTLNFQTTSGDASIFEDNRTDLVGTNFADTITIDSSGSIRDNTNATIEAKTGDATFDAGSSIVLANGSNTLTVAGHADLIAKTGIQVGTDGDVNFGSVRFNTENGDATIIEDSSTELRGVNQADSLLLSSAGSITEQGATRIDIVDSNPNVEGNATLLAKGSIDLGDSNNDRFVVEGQLTVDAPFGISLGKSAVNRFGSINFNSSNGDVEIHEDGSTLIVGSNTADSLTLTSGFRNSNDDGSITSKANTQIVVDQGKLSLDADGSIELSGNAADELTVATNAKFAAGGDVTIGEEGENNFGTLTFVANSGKVNIQEDSATHLVANNQARELELRSNGNITQAASSSITVNQGNTNSSSGATTVGLTQLKAGVNGDQDIVLDGSKNDFNRLEIEGAANATIVETNDIIFHDILVDGTSGNLKVNAGDGVTQLNTGGKAASSITAQTAEFEVGYVHLGSTSFQQLMIDRADQSDNLIAGKSGDVKDLDRGVRFNSKALTSRNAGSITLADDPGVDKIDGTGPGIADEGSQYTVAIQNSGSLVVSNLETTGGNVYIETTDGGHLAFTGQTVVGGNANQLNAIAGGQLAVLPPGSTFQAGAGVTREFIPRFIVESVDGSGFEFVDPIDGIQTIRLTIGLAGEQFFQVRVTYADGAVQEFPVVANSIVGATTTDFARQTSGVNSIGDANTAYSQFFLLQNPVLTSTVEVISDSRINLFADGGDTDLNVRSAEVEARLTRATIITTNATVETPKIYVPEPPTDQLADPVDADSELVEFDDIRPFVTAEVKELFSVRIEGNEILEKTNWDQYEPSEVDKIVQEILNNPIWKRGTYQILRTTADGSTEVLREFTKDLQLNNDPDSEAPGEEAPNASASLEPADAQLLAEQQEARDIQVWMEHLWRQQTITSDAGETVPGELGVSAQLDHLIDEQIVSADQADSVSDPVALVTPSTDSNQGDEQPTGLEEEVQTSNLVDGRFRAAAAKVGVATTVAGAMVMARLAKQADRTVGREQLEKSAQDSDNENPFSKQSRRRRKNAR